MSDVKATVPDAFGKVIVRSAVGSVTAKVVLKPSTVNPSKINALVPCILPVILVLPDKVVAPDKVVVPDKPVTPLAANVVKDPVEGVVAPIVVLFMVPPLIVAVFMVGEVKVLFVSVCASLVPTIVPAGACWPSNKSELRLLTRVGLITVNGEVPLATDELKVLAVML